MVLPQRLYVGLDGFVRCVDDGDIICDSATIGGYTGFQGELDDGGV